MFINYFIIEFMDQSEEITPIGSNVSSKKSQIKNYRRSRSFRNGRMVVDVKLDKMISEISAPVRQDRFGQSISQSKTHRISFAESPETIEVENWKQLNKDNNGANGCKACGIF